MEGESRFNRAESGREYYRQLLEFISQEIERNPELQAELTQFVGYIDIVQQIAPLITWLPTREERIQAVHWEIEREAFPNLPIQLPLPHKKVSVGEHMDITLGVSARTCWPDRDLDALMLADGTVITPKTPIGRIDIVRGFDPVSANTNLIGFMREFMQSSVLSMKDLATLCLQNDSRLDDVEVFAGVSHLARVAGKFGFTTFDIADEQEKAAATNVSKRVAEYVSGGNKTWKRIKENYKPAQIAYISRSALEQKFGV